VVELAVVDFVGSFGLEALVNESELAVAAAQFEVVEDLLEAAHRQEARALAVLVLEEGFDQKAAQLYFACKAL
jgi:hypothetical protein